MSGDTSSPNDLNVELYIQVFGTSSSFILTAYELQEKTSRKIRETKAMDKWRLLNHYTNTYKSKSFSTLQFFATSISK